MILLVAWMVAFAALSARSAAAKSRSVATWAGLGAVLGPIALVILEVAPPGRCWACDAQVVGWETICQWCGTDVRPDPARASRRRLGRSLGRGQARPATTSDAIVTASVAAVSVAAPVETPVAETPAAAPVAAAAAPPTTRKRTTRTTKRAAAGAGTTAAARSRKRSTPAGDVVQADANGTGPAVDADHMPPPRPGDRDRPRGRCRRDARCRPGGSLVPRGHRRGPARPDDAPGDRARGRERGRGLERPTADDRRG